jgi:hypothetical protein
LRLLRKRKNVLFIYFWKDAAPGIAEVEDARKRLDGLIHKNLFIGVTAKFFDF